MRTSGFCALVLVCMLSISVLCSFEGNGEHAQESAAHASDAGVWDLSASGCVGDSHDSSDGPRITFGSTAEIVVLCHKKSESARSRDMSVLALAIETNSGRVSRTLEWSGSGASAVYGTFQGNYAILRKGTVLYGRGLVEEIAQSPHEVVEMSPAGGRYLARTRPDKKKEVWITVDAESLRDQGVLPGFHEGSISDESVASVHLGLPNSPLVRIERAGKAPVDYSRGYPGGSPHFVSEDAILIDFPERFEIISAEGKRFLSKSHGEEDDIHVTAARDGRRMAITRDRHSGHWSELEFEQITVYQLPSGSPIWSFKHRGMKGAFTGHSDVVLSPDGSLLAIKWPEKVRLFRLPT